MRKRRRRSSSYLSSPSQGQTLLQELGPQVEPVLSFKEKRNQ